MTRVLHVCEPPDGGAAANAAALALGMAARGFEVEYAGPPGARPLAELEAAGVAVHRLALAPSFFNTGADGRALRALDRLLAGGRFDLVHLHSSKAGVLGRLAAARRRGVRVVYSPHSFPFVGDLPRPRVALATAIERGLARLTDEILCVCDWEVGAAAAARLRPRHGATRVYNGVDEFPAGVEVAPELAAWRAEGEGPIVAALAVLRRQKRLDLLIEAAPAILAGNPGARLALIGSGPEGAELEALARARGLDREPRFRMIPFTATTQSYLAGLDAYVLPSAWEAFPIGVLEAMAAGVPQVATDVGGTSEAVLDGVTGLLVPPRDAAALAAAVLEILQDESRRERMSIESRKRHRDHFLTATMIDETIAIYRALGA
jgi:glycosyltransferase involved in cell wall biosynthesis